MTKKRANQKLNTALFSVDLDIDENRIIAPEWIELIPAGDHVPTQTQDGRWFSNSNPEGIVAAFYQTTQSLPIDFEHAIEARRKDAVPVSAIGWIEGMEVREGAVYGRAKWNDEGRRAIESGG